MSLYDYEMSKRITGHDYPFYALIMAAMRQADTDNLAQLNAAFPRVREELHLRYHAPGGQLPSDGNEVVALGPDDYERGVEDEHSRSQSRPGYGDMGG